MRVTWTDPAARPRGGYRIEVTGDTSSNISNVSSPEEISLSSPGSYVITLVSLTVKYPIINNTIMENITLIGEGSSN